MIALESPQSRFLNQVVGLKLPKNINNGLNVQSNVKPAFIIKPAPLANKNPSFALGLSPNSDGTSGADTSNNRVPSIETAYLSTVTLKPTKKASIKILFQNKGEVISK